MADEEITGRAKCGYATAAAMTAEQRIARARAGAIAQRKGMTKRQRSEAARNAALARWGRRPAA
jgi:hypothetical protein